jgi:ryanodine receptor 2
MKTSREACKNEFIIPLGPDLRKFYDDPEMCHSLRSLMMHSVRPTMKMTEIA